MCCWKTSRVDAVTKANEYLFDETVSTSSASLLDTIFQVVWPTLVAPKILDEIRNKPMDLGENSKGYTVRISSGSLSNLRLQFTHVGVVKTTTATAKAFYERSMHTWTLNDVRVWLGSGLSMTEERLAELEPLLEKSFFNGANLAKCTPQELETSFKFTKEESMRIISLRAEYASPDYVKQLVEKIVGAAQNASSNKDDGATDTKDDGATDTKDDGATDTKEDAATDTKEDAATDTKDDGATDTKDDGAADTKVDGVTDTNDDVATDTKEEEDQDDANNCSVVDIDVGINLSGESYIELQMENESDDLPNMVITVQQITLDAKVRIQIDLTNEEVRIAFFEKAQIEISADAEPVIETLDVPLFGESRWLEDAVEHVLEGFSLDNPIIMPLGDAAGARTNEVTKRSVRRAF